MLIHSKLFSRASHQLTKLSFDWFTGLPSSLVIGYNDSLGRVAALLKWFDTLREDNRTKNRNNTTTNKQNNYKSTRVASLLDSFSFALHDVLSQEV